QLGVAQRIEGVIAVAAVQHAEAQQNADCAKMRDQKIDKAGPAVLLAAMFRGNEKVRRERHRLPGDHEQIRVIRDEYERHAREKDMVLEAQQPHRLIAMPEIAGAKQGYAERYAAQQQQKKAGQRID